MLGRLTIASLFLLLVGGNLLAGVKEGDLALGMELVHRSLAAVAALCIVTLAHRRFLSYEGYLKGVPLAVITLLLGQIALGARTVLQELPLRLTILHFATSLIIFVLTFYLASFDGKRHPPAFSVRGYTGIFFGLGLLVFSQSLLGAYVRHAGAGLACPGFFTCGGAWWPPAASGAAFLQFSHRLTAMLLLFTFLLLTIATRRDRWLSLYRGMGATLVIITLLQITVGAIVVRLALHPAATALHLTLALILLLVMGRLWILAMEDE